MLDSLQDWNEAFAALEPKADSAWAGQFADLLGDLTDNKLTITGLTPNSVFSFDRAGLEAALLPIVAGPPPASQTQIATAWASAVSASTMVVSVGSSVGAPPTPATTFSVVSSTVVDAPSVVAAQGVLLTSLLSALPVEDPELSTVPVAFRTAFLSLTYTITGTNSVAPPAGPNPLTLPALPVS